MNENYSLISVSYNSEEILIEIDPYDNDNFKTFIENLSEKTGEKNILSNFKLTCINSNIPYLSVDENNFWNFVFETRKEEKLKLLMNKKEKNEEDENNDYAFLGGIKASNDNDFDDFNEDFDLKENSFEDNNNDKNINKEEKNKLIIKEEEDNKKLENENKLLLNKIEKEEKVNNIKINNIILEDDKNMRIDENKRGKEKENNFIKEEKVGDINKIEKNDKFIKNEKHSHKDNLLNNIFIDESCSICENKLINTKYICIICDRYIFCSTCGEKHDHPCIIYKTPFISSLGETYQFITKNYNFPSMKKNQRNLSISLLADKNIYVRPNKGLLIPIKIMNNSNITINSSEFIILVTGNKLINITYDCSSLFKILPNTFYVLKLKCITPKIKCSENINFELYSTNFVLKENTNGIINCNIEINEDMEEESSNFKLCYNEMAILYNKEHKQLLASLIENELKGYDVDEIIEAVVSFNWDKEKLLNHISSLEKNN